MSRLYTESALMKCSRCGTVNVIADWKAPAITAVWPVSSAPRVTRERRPQVPSVASLVLGVFNLALQRFEAGDTRC